MFKLKNWRRDRSPKMDTAQWRSILAGLPLCELLTSAQRSRLIALSSEFMYAKQIVGAQGLELEPEQCGFVAASLCLPLLKLGPDWWRGWQTVILHPDEFLTSHREVDEAGVEHDFAEARTGECWLDGPMVLSWADLNATGGGYNVAIHEMAHKLDMLDGPVNGRPPLHAHMDGQRWASAFTQAFDDLTARIKRGEETAIDPYACESPDEFFAVISEAWFETPDIVRELYPRVYEQIKLFYDGPEKPHGKHRQPSTPAQE